MLWKVMNDVGNIFWDNNNQKPLNFIKALQFNCTQLIMWLLSHIPKYKGNGILTNQ